MFRPQRAIILAAGTSSRLLPDTAEMPKTLLSLGPESILECQMRMLRAAGIAEIAIVTGHGAAHVCQRAGAAARFIHNDRYLETSSLYSLWMAEEFGAGGCLILNSDVLFHPAMLSALLDAPAEDALLVDFRDTLGEEEMKVIVRDGAVAEISKNIAPALAHGENVGIVKAGPAGAKALFAAAAQLLRAAQWSFMVPDAVGALAGQRPFAAVSTGGLPWIEIDYHHDLERARQEIYPRVAGAV